MNGKKHFLDFACGFPGSNNNNNNALFTLATKRHIYMASDKLQEIKICICLKLSQENKRTLRFSSNSPAFYVQNKIRLRDVKRRVQTQEDRPNHMSSRYSKEVK